MENTTLIGARKTNRIKINRLEAGLTCEEMANLLGISKSAYSLKERGKRDFKLTEAIMLSDIFEKPIKSLFLP